MRILKTILAAALLVIALGCSTSASVARPTQPRAVRPEADQSQGHEAWTYNLAIYEINIRQYTEEGTFNALAEHLDRLQDMGVGILWLMPIHPIGEQNRLGRLGSYYSVRDFMDVNPEFGTMQDFANLVDAIHARDMHVILDWVPNHTSWDNVLTETNPEWYTTNQDGEFINPPGTNWSDVIQLNHSRQGLKDYMIDAMSFWVDDMGVDGFRFDAVSHVPASFLIETNNAMKERFPDIFLLAEADGTRWHDFGFSASFAWNLYGFGSGLLPRISNGTANADSLESYFASEQQTYGDSYRLYFTDNHDENSWHGTTRERFGDAAEVFSVLVHTAAGMPLVYSGQEAGLDHSLEFFEKDVIDWSELPNQDLYTALLQLKRENQAVWNGRFGGELERIPTDHDQDVFAFYREQEGDQVLVVLNLSDRDVSATLSGNGYSGQYRDVFGDDEIRIETDSTVSLSAWGYVVYERI